MPGGRPTTYNDELLELAGSYLSEFEREQHERTGQVAKEVIPTVVGLCRYIGRAKSTVYKWLTEDDKSEFSDIVSALEENQQIGLISGGLSGGYNPMITKLILSKHGYSEKSEVDHRSGDGSMTPRSYTPEQYQTAQDNLDGNLDDLD